MASDEAGKVIVANPRVCFDFILFDIGWRGNTFAAPTIWDEARTKYSGGELMSSSPPVFQRIEDDEVTAPFVHKSAAPATAGI